MKNPLRAVAIVLNILALITCGLLLLSGAISVAAGESLITVVVLGGPVSALVALLWPMTRESTL